jgi:hypothetical protein
MTALMRILSKSGLLEEDLDYHLLRASMVIIFLSFGCQKWFESSGQNQINPFASLFSAAKSQATRARHLEPAAMRCADCPHDTGIAMGTS